MSPEPQDRLRTPVRRVLLIDDQPDVANALARFFRREGWEPHTAPDAETGLSISAAEVPDLVVLDLELPGMGGIDALRHLIAAQPRTAVIILTGHADIPRAVEAIRIGAENFLTKPVDLAHLGAAAERAYEKVQLRRRNTNLIKRIGSHGDRLAALGESRHMRELASQVELIAGADDTSVLILGESGTGKGWLARTLHDLSGRSAGPWMEINCAGLSATFLHSELFGHEKGAFTGADQRRKGLFELADGGTVFLDEIGDLAPELQPKLLKILEDREFRRLGGTSPVAVDIRLIAATNRDLRGKVESGEFREDLYYRLNVVPIVLPPLRDRSGGDRVDLMERILESLRAQMGARTVRLSDRAIQSLLNYSWPGNVRELRNVLERAIILAGGAGAGVIDPEHLPLAVRSSPLDSGWRTESEGKLPTLVEIERDHVERTLRALGGNRTRAAESLGVTRATLLRKIQRFGLEATGKNEE